MYAFLDISLTRTPISCALLIGAILAGTLSGRVSPLAAQTLLSPSEELYLYEAVIVDLRGRGEIGQRHSCGGLKFYTGRDVAEGMTGMSFEQANILVERIRRRGIVAEACREPCPLERDQLAIVFRRPVILKDRKVRVVLSTWGSDSDPSGSFFVFQRSYVFTRVQGKLVPERRELLGQS